MPEIQEILIKEANISHDGVGKLILTWAQNPSFVEAQIEKLRGGEPANSREVLAFGQTIFDEAFSGKMPAETGYSREIFTYDERNRPVTVIFFRVPKNDEPKGADDFAYAYLVGSTDNPSSFIMSAEVGEGRTKRNVLLIPNLKERISLHHPPTKFESYSGNIEPTVFKIKNLVSQAKP